MRAAGADGDENWAGLAGSVQRMLADRQRTNELLNQIEQRAKVMRDGIVPNTQREYKTHVPPLVGEINLLREEIRRVEDEKERMLELLINIKAGLDAEDPGLGVNRLLGSDQKRRDSTSSKRDRDETEEDVIDDGPFLKPKSKKKKTGKGAIILTTPARTQRPKTTTTAQPSKKTEPRAQVPPSADAATRTKKRKEEEKTKENTAKSRSIHRRNDSIRVSVTKGTFAEVLKDLKTKVDVSQLETEIRGYKESKKGDIVIHLGPKKEDMDTLIAQLKSAAGPSHTVELMRAKTWIQIRDMDGDTTAEEVKAALSDLIGEEANACKVTITRPNWRKQRTAIVEVAEDSAAKLMQAGKVRIGWIVCRIYKKTMVTRCYNCLGYGHYRDQCKGPDRSGCCYRCGKSDHKAAACPNEPECVLCKEKGIGEPDLRHIPGTASCKAFLEARGKEAKRNNRKKKWRASSKAT